MTRAARAAVLALAACGGACVAGSPGPLDGSVEDGATPRADAGATLDGGAPDATPPTDAAGAADAAAPDAAAPVDAGPGEVDAGHPPDGTWEHPFLLDPLPATASGDTTALTQRRASAYTPCAPSTDERGPEVVYITVPPADGTLSVTVDDVPGDAVDVDVHLLDAPVASACRARGNVSLSARVVAGAPAWIVVDTWFDGAAERAGPYVLRVWLVADPPLGTCPADMRPIPGGCMDRFEAPNLAGALPLVMYSFDEAENWCAARGRRLCFEDEWTAACAGAAGTAFPYGPSRQPGVCNDEETWRTYDQALLNGWPASAAAATVTSLAELLGAARAASGAAAAAADHVERLYQGEGAGLNAGCTNETGVLDLVGNVEEWTRRRTPGGAAFHGNLKGRYWADTRTCQDNITVHGDGFRFYEIGFRCCQDAP